MLERTGIIFPFADISGLFPLAVSSNASALFLTVDLIFSFDGEILTEVANILRVYARQLKICTILVSNIIATIYVQVRSKNVIGTLTAKKSCLTKETQLQVARTTSHIIGLIETVKETWLCVCWRGIGSSTSGSATRLQLLLGEYQTG